MAGMMAAEAQSRPAHPPSLRPAPPETIAWLKENVIPLDTALPSSGFDDLMPLKEIIGDARIVALGEATHGTSEFFTMKHRLVEFLASEMGFTVFAIEANMPEAYRINEYVLTGEGDPAELLKGMYFWTWNTQEVLDMILWMRAFNASGQGTIQFTGFDLQFPGVAMEEVRRFVAEQDPAYLPTLEAHYERVAGVNEERGYALPGELTDWKLAANAVLRHLEANRRLYLVESSPSETAWALQNARIVRQAAEARLEGPQHATRDESMAANVRWIVEQNPGEKLVLWAHNCHIEETGLYCSMGGHLAAHYGDDYLSIGFAFYQGRYTAFRQSEGLRAYRAGPAPAGSVGGAFHATGWPHFLLDLQGVEGTPAAPLLMEPVPMRDIGAIATDDAVAFHPVTLSEAYDAVVFIDRSTASDLLSQP